MNMFIFIGLGLPENDYNQFSDWDELSEKFKEIFLSKTQEGWCKVFDFSDACVTPVVPLEEAHKHKHNSERNSFVTDGSVIVPVPAPKLSDTPGEISTFKPVPGEHTIDILLEAGYQKEEIDTLLKDKVVYSASLKSSL